MTQSTVAGTQISDKDIDLGDNERGPAIAGGSRDDPQADQQGLMDVAMVAEDDPSEVDKFPERKGA